MPHYGNMGIHWASPKPNIVLVVPGHILIDYRFILRRGETAGEFKLERPKEQDQKLIRHLDLNKLEDRFRQPTDVLDFMETHQECLGIVVQVEREK
jgi:hypothetical protein